MEKKATIPKAAGGKKEPRIVAPDKDVKKRKRNRAKGAGPWEEETVRALPTLGAGSYSRLLLRRLRG